MKFNIKKDILLENINNVSKAISNKNIIPVLSGIKFDLKKEGLFLTSSDDDITIQSFISKKDIESIEEIGSIVIPGRYFIEIIRKIPNELIKIETDGLRLIIYTDTAEYDLNGINPLEFPNRNLELSNTPIVISKDIIRNIVLQTSFAISTQESRPILTGINFKINKNILECVATDSYRLAKKIIELDVSLDSEVNIVIPGKNLIELSKIITEENDNIEIHIFSNTILFKFNTILFQSRLLNGTYPDTSKLINEEAILRVTANTNELYNVIDRASLLTTEKDKNVVKIETNKNELIVTSTSQEIGKIEEKMKISKDNDSEIKISFSSKYMMDAIRALKSENIILLLNGEVKPIIIKDETNSNLIQLVLPIKTF
jgi:DNA polymerase-3 subunit beta